MPTLGDPIPGQSGGPVPQSEMRPVSSEFPRLPGTPLGTAVTPEEADRRAAQGTEANGPLPGKSESRQTNELNLSGLYGDIRELDDKLHNKLITEVVIRKPYWDSLILFHNTPQAEPTPGFLTQGGLVLLEKIEAERIQASINVQKTGFGAEEIQRLPDDFEPKYEFVDDDAKMAQWKDGVTRSKASTEAILKREAAVREYVPQATQLIRTLSQELPTS